MSQRYMRLGKSPWQPYFGIELRVTGYDPLIYSRWLRVGVHYFRLWETERVYGGPERSQLETTDHNKGEENGHD